MKNVTRFCFLAVPTAVIVCFLFFPLIQAIVPTIFPDGPSFSNYTAFFKDELNRTVFYRSLRISIITTVICILTGIPASFFLSRLDIGTRRVLNSFILFPLLTNAVVRGFAWISILGKNGILNKILQELNLIQHPVQLLYTEPAIIIGSVYLFLPVMISTLSSVMEKTGTDIEEAAYTLGANPAVVFFRIIVPLSLPGIITGSVLVFAGTISAYTTPTLLGGNRKMMLSTLLYQQSNTLANWSNAAVISFIMIIISLGIMHIFNTVAATMDKRGAYHA